MRCCFIISFNLVKLIIINLIIHFNASTLLLNLNLNKLFVDCLFNNVDYMNNYIDTEENNYVVNRGGNRAAGPGPPQRLVSDGQRTPVTGFRVPIDDADEASDYYSDNEGLFEYNYSSDNLNLNKIDDHILQTNLIFPRADDDKQRRRDNRHAAATAVSPTSEISVQIDNYVDRVYDNRGSFKCNEHICTDGVFKWHESKTKNVYVGGIFPMVGNWAGGQSCLPSAIMALNEVNLNASILPNYRLNLNWFNSECNPGKGINNLYEMIFRKEKNQDDVIMLLGPGCSDVSSSVAEAANYWNLTVLSFGSSSPALSNRKRFKTFFRTHPSAILDNPARFSLCNKYNWSKIATLQNNQEVFTSTVDDLEKEAKHFNIEIFARQTFTNDPTYAVKNLKNQDARIIVGVFYEEQARKVFCQAYKEGMLFPKYIWMIIGWYSENWYFEGNPGEISCNRTEMEIAVYGHLTTEVEFFTKEIHKKLDYGISVMEYNENFRKFVSSQTWKNFAKGFSKIDYKYAQTHSPAEENKSLYNLYENIDNQSKQIEKLGGYSERALAYDAVWVMAYSLNKTLNHFGSLDDFRLSKYQIGNYIRETMSRTNFEGISGLVQFNDQGDRISRVLYEQLQNHSGVLSYVKLGSHFMNKFDCCHNITWGQSKNPPVDGVHKIYQIRKINPFYSKLFFAFSLLSIVIGIVCLVFNHKFVNRKIIKYSEPEINNTLVVGCFLCLLSIFLFGYDKNDLPVQFFNILCRVGVSMLMIGFTIGYGSLFSKIWFTYTTSIEKKKNHPSADIAPNKYKLYAIIAAMILVDSIILLVWMLNDPLKKSIQRLPAEAVKHDEIIYEPQINVCKCNHENVWIGICFSIKGIVLILGLYLGYETRNCKLDHVNDSKYIALSIYNIVVLTLITAPIVLIIQNQHQLDAAFSFIALSINLCSLSTFALIFIPKIKHIMRHSTDVDLNELDNHRQCLEQKKEKYFKLRKENEDLNEIIQKREELRSKLERLLIPSTGSKKTENVKFNFDKCNSKNLTVDETSSMSMHNSNSNNNTSMYYNFEIQSEYSTKNATIETEF